MTRVPGQPAQGRRRGLRDFGRHLPDWLPQGLRGAPARLGHRLPRRPVGGARWAGRRRLRCGGRGDPEAARRAGRLDARRREPGREGGRRKRTEKFAQEGAAYSLFSLPPAKAAGLRAGPPSVPANLPGCSSPKAQALPFAGWQQ